MFRNARAGDILLYRPEGKDVVGGAIGFFSNLFGRKSDYVHSAYYLGNRQVLHSHLVVNPATYIRGAEKSGVHIANIPGTDYPLIDVFRFNKTEKQRAKMEEFLYSQLGKDYDAPAFPSAFIRSVLGIFSADRPISNNPDAWYCSELDAVAAHFAGIELVPGIHPMSVIPADLGSSRSILRRVS